MTSRAAIARFCRSERGQPMRGKQRRPTTMTTKNRPSTPTASKQQTTVQSPPGPCCRYVGIEGCRQLACPRAIGFLGFLPRRPKQTRPKSGRLVSVPLFVVQYGRLLPCSLPRRSCLFHPEQGLLLYSQDPPVLATHDCRRHLRTRSHRTNPPAVPEEGCTARDEVRCQQACPPQNDLPPDSTFPPTLPRGQSINLAPLSPSDSRQYSSPRTFSQPGGTP